MGSIKTEEKQITKQRSGFFGTADGGAVGLINECKAAVARLFLKTSSDFAERGRIDFLEGPAGRPELVERAEKMIGIARDRFCHQRGLFVVAHSSGEFFGGDGKEQPEMFAQCKLQPDFAQQGFAQLRRRQKLYSDERVAGAEQLVAKKIGLTARCSHDRSRLDITQCRLTDRLKPWADHILPGRFRRSADVQRHVGRRFLNFAAQLLHRPI